MKFKSIRSATLVVILPAILMATVAMSLLSYYSAKSLISKQIEDKMNSQLGENINGIKASLQKHGQIPATLSRIVESSYNTMTKENFMSLVQKAPTTNPDTLGTGVWFEPNKYKSDIKYFAPYGHRDKDKIVYTDDYATEQYNYPGQDWYTMAKNTNKIVVWSKPYYDETSKATMVTVSAPFYDENKQFLGVTTGDIDVSNIQKMIGNIKVGEKGNAILLSREGIYMAGADSSKIMKTNITQDSNSSLAAAGKEILEKKKGEITFNDSNGKNRLYYASDNDTGWTVGLIISEKELFSPLTVLMLNLIKIIAVIFIIIILVAVFYSKYITDKIKPVSELSKVIADGDLTQKLEIKSEDELGQMGKHLNDMVSNLKDIVSGVSSAIESVVATSEELTASSDQTKVAADEIARSVQDMASNEEKQNEITDKVSKASEIVFNGMKSISDSVDKVNKSSIESCDKAKDGNKVVEQAIEHMNKINDKVTTSSNIINVLARKSNEIGNIVSLITDVSEQTNLLALNAAIEASRAGEQGRGFSVVAEEVRKLAEESGNSAKQINVLILEIQNEIASAVKSMNEGTNAVKQGIVVVKNTGESFQSILSAVDDVSKQMQKTSNEVVETYNGTKEVVNSMNRIIEITKQSSEGTQNIAAATEEQSALMKEVANAAEVLSQMAMELERIFSKFKI
ncbi:methyl-accepting chemotaxis protein [Clostridium sp. P21]|uniref:Methyl-accepting chemotaxis protein n=1 Tax=Clostridium muellerianum TaxID=2716538 RepID=A0A7Y0EM54_9CLOT|nr:methyl-accepting chemotaxis protein [Clostridium muellerianum]NMM65947.1 methyl-accepting chemotaxis protein [Clostridium muellerianum]